MRTKTSILIESSNSTDAVPSDPMTVLMARVDNVWDKLDQTGAVTTEDVQSLRDAIQKMTPARELTDDQVYDAQPQGAQHTDDGRYVVDDDWLQDFAHNILAAADGARTVPATEEVGAQHPYAYSYECEQPFTNPPVWAEFINRDKPNESVLIRNVFPLYLAAPAAPTDKKG